MSGWFQSILQWIYSWLGNYGWSVVVFTLLVRMVLLPLDIKSKKSMRAMNKVQPKVNALQKKYANDKEKLNVKLNELYKKEHVSPMSGCLPLLISLPILWFMFGAMRNMANEHTVRMILDMKEMLDGGAATEAVAESVRANLQGWLWIKNVFQPDSFMATILPSVGDELRMIQAVNGSAILNEANLTVAREFLTTDAYAAVAAQFGTNAFTTMQLHLLIVNPTLMIPSSFANMFKYANGLFILPLLAGASQFLMTGITSGQQQTKKDGNAPEEENAVANTMNSGFMKWFFPLFSLYICAGYNAAFAIYWMAANVIQILQQLVVNWYFDKKDKEEAAAEAKDESIK